MYVHPSHLFISILLSAAQGLFSFKAADPKIDIWASKCETFLRNSNKEHGYPIRISPMYDWASISAVKHSLLEMIKLKKEVLKQFPPEEYEYIFLGSDPAVLAALFELDSRIRNQTFNLPMSISGYGYDVSDDDSKRIFKEVLGFLNYSHDRTKKILMVAYASDGGYEAKYTSRLLSDLDDESFWREVTFALVGQRYPKNGRGEPVELRLGHAFFQISAISDALLFNDYFSVLSPMYRANLPAWDAMLAGKVPLLVPPPIYDRFLEITREEFPDGL